MLKQLKMKGIFFFKISLVRWLNIACFPFFVVAIFQFVVSLLFILSFLFIVPFMPFLKIKMLFQNKFSDTVIWWSVSGSIFILHHHKCRASERCLEWRWTNCTTFEFSDEPRILSLTMDPEIPQERLPVPLDLSFDTSLFEFCRREDLEGHKCRNLNIWKGGFGAGCMLVSTQVE